MTVRLAGKLGRQQQVRDDLLRRDSRQSEVKELDQARRESSRCFANLFVELGDLDSAEKIYTDLAARNRPWCSSWPNSWANIAIRKNVLPSCNEIYKPLERQRCYRRRLGRGPRRRDKIGDKYDAEIQRWLDAALRENPDSIALLHLQADMYDLQKKYEESAERLSQTVGPQRLGRVFAGPSCSTTWRSCWPSIRRPRLAATTRLRWSQEAADIMGPNSDILDTRAVVLDFAEGVQGAIRDLELAVTDSPTASKYYHKAVAHLGAGENKAAVKAWQKAEELGLDRDSLNRMEYEQYDEMKKEDRPDSRRVGDARRIAEPRRLIRQHHFRPTATHHDEHLPNTCAHPDDLRRDMLIWHCRPAKPSNPQ